jgi:hypothetical protein
LDAAAHSHDARRVNPFPHRRSFTRVDKKEELVKAFLFVHLCNRIRQILGKKLRYFIKHATRSHEKYIDEGRRPSPKTHPEVDEPPFHLFVISELHEFIPTVTCEHHLPMATLSYVSQQSELVDESDILQKHLEQQTLRLTMILLLVSDSSLFDLGTKSS